MLITRETKLEIVKKHLEEGVTLKELSEECGIHSSRVLMRAIFAECESYLWFFQFVTQ